MGRTGWLVLALGAAAILAGAAIALAWTMARDPAPAAIDDALAAFRAALAGRAPAERPVPEGVYVYA
ncbi:MAG: hypothetical protein NZL88_12040, partial [Gaiellaceae bacterium]|nr:hypothetical protein [Gaiellaceae bacterium]